MDSIYISAAHKSSGKTIVSIGLSRIFSNLKYNIQTFKKGPDYIDMSWLSLASRRGCYNLDFNTQKKIEINNFYNEKKSEINIIEGNKGLYDGLSIDGSDDNSAMSILLNTGIILVVDTEGITRGIAPLLQGYINFEKKCKIKGVILNKVKTERHENKLINSVENYTDLKILGSIRKNKDLHISERHLGLVPANEKKAAENKINLISDIISESINKKEFKRIGVCLEEKKLHVVSSNSRSWPYYKRKIINAYKIVLKNEEKIQKIKAKTKIKLGIFRDQSFGFYYTDDIENFEKFGVDIVYIDSTKDKKLPAIDALFIGGGFPEINAKRIEKNKTLMKDVKSFIELGNPCYAECGGLMYLSKSIKYKNKKYTMSGVLSGEIVISDKPIGRGYVNLKIKKNHPWKIKNKNNINAHEFHHAELILRENKKNKYAYDINRGYGINGVSDGLTYKNLLANFSHLRHTKKYPWIKYFINFIKDKKND